MGLLNAFRLTMRELGLKGAADRPPSLADYLAAKSASGAGGMITASEAIADESLLGRPFRGSSWSPWRAVLRAAEGLPLDDDQHRDFCRVAEREPRAACASCGALPAGARAKTASPRPSPQLPR
jgi:hypothetical protein